MIKAHYNKDCNTIVIEFSGRVDLAEAERFFPEVQALVPKCKDGFRLLTDFTLLEKMDDEVRGPIKRSMDFFNEQGVRDIVRIIPDDEKDFGFNILSAFHYSKDVTFRSFPSREEALAQLKSE